MSCAEGADSRVSIVPHCSYGNRFYENLDEQPGRHRWVDYSAHDFNTQQVEPIWHSWLQHIRQDPPNQDPIVAEKRRTWETVRADGTVIHQQMPLHIPSLPAYPFPIPPSGSIFDG